MTKPSGEDELQACAAYCVADSFRMRQLSDHLRGLGLHVSSCDDGVLHTSQIRQPGCPLEHGPTCHAFYFPSGATVFWGYSRAERLALLDSVRSCGDCGGGGGGGGGSRLDPRQFKHEFGVRIATDAEGPSEAEQADRGTAQNGPTAHNVTAVGAAEKDAAGVSAAEGPGFDQETDEVVLRGWPTPHATHSTDGDAAHTVMTAEHDTPQPQEDEDDKEARDLQVRPEGEAEQYREQVMEMLAISFGLAQSVKLVVFENEMEVRRCH